MSAGEAVFYHGRLSLVAAIIGVLTGVGALLLWQPLLILAVFWFAIAGWHIGGVVRHSIAAQPSKGE